MYFLVFRIKDSITFITRNSVYYIKEQSHGFNLSYVVDPCTHHYDLSDCPAFNPARVGQALVRLSRRRRTQFLLITHRAAVRAHVYYRRRNRLLHQPHQQHLLLHKERTQSRYRTSAMRVLCCSLFACCSGVLGFYIYNITLRFILSTQHALLSSFIQTFNVEFSTFSKNCQIRFVRRSLLVFSNCASLTIRPSLFILTL